MGQERCVHTFVFPALCFVMRRSRAHALLACFRLVISISLSIFIACAFLRLPILRFSVSFLCTSAVRNGHIKRITDPDIQSSVLEIAGSNVSTTYITCPADPKQTLGIKLPFLVMIIKNVRRCAFSARPLRAPSHHRLLLFSLFDFVYGYCELVKLLRACCQFVVDSHGTPAVCPLLAYRTIAALHL